MVTLSIFRVFCISNQLYFNPRQSRLAGKAKGGLFLTGAREWSSNRVLDDRGHSTGYAWEYDFPHGRRWKDPHGYTGNLRALCVRSSGE
jgi:hypothetical protein